MASTMKSMKYIKDPIHGYIEVDEITLNIIDTPIFQRLRNIRQLGMANLVYPGSNHTRFEHSLGVYKLGREFANALKLDPEDGENISIAGLLHDLGHGPFSHLSDELIEDRTGLGHESRACELISNSEISDILKENGLDVKEICEYIKGEGEYGGLIAGSIDIDKLDYLLRDSYYTGAGFVVFDLPRILARAKIFGGGLAINEKGLAAVESLLLARCLMYKNVYYHHTVRIGGLMMTRAIEYALDKDLIDVERLAIMDDYELISRLRSSEEYSKKLVQMIFERRLFKKVYESEYIPSISKEGARAMESRLAEGCGLEAGWIVVDNLFSPLWEELNILIETDSGFIPVMEISEIAAALARARNSWFKVYSPEEYEDRVKNLQAFI